MIRRTLLLSSLTLWLVGLTTVVANPVPPAKPLPDSEQRWYVARNGPPTWRLLSKMSEQIEFSEVRLQAGDDLQWAQPGFDDRGWRVIARGKPPYVPARAGIMWMRFRVRWNSHSGHLPAGLRFLFLSASYEVYWDGVLVGRNGVPGRSLAEEVEGVSQYNPGLPLSMTGPGEHVLALRLSSYHMSDPEGFTGLLTLVMTPEAFDAVFRRDNLFPVMATGALFTITIAALVIWVIAARRRVLLLFAGMCLFGGVMEAFSWYSLAYVYPVSWLHGLNVIIAATGLALSLCLAAVMLDEWSVPRRRWWLAGLLIVDAVRAAIDFPFVDSLAQKFIGASFAFVLGCCVWALWRRKHGAWAVAATVAASGAMLWDSPGHFIGSEFFRRFLPTVLGVLLIIALRLRAERRQAQETRLTAARLEIELLKKNLQPHFLMNTLTALAQTVEEEPARAVKLIDDLAQEFRTLARMAAEKIVPLAEELELCRAHLRVMRARTDVDWQLEVHGLDGAAGVPPALFLTLIENGFSHQRVREGDRTFTLRAAAHGAAVRYQFRSPGEVTAETSRMAGGTGLSYVRARLEESFPGAWTLVQGEADGAWQTVIDVPALTHAGRPA